MALRTARRLLLDQFGDQPVVISAMQPEDVRRFIAGQRELYSTPASAGALASALRGYFRFRATRGDQVHGLIGVVSYPANWQLASLPKALSGAEVARLVGSLGQGDPSARRTDAIVRCALDLGLRSSEVAKLGLDDIDWRAGTVTLRRTKSRREDILPLPEATGRAIADYLRFERPQSANRSVFVRRVAPRDQQIGTDLIRKKIRQAYTRAGLPYPGRIFCATPWPAACWRASSLKGGRCFAPSLAEHDADLRQTRQRNLARSRYPGRAQHECDPTTSMNFPTIIWASAAGWDFLGSTGYAVKGFARLYRRSGPWGAGDRQVMADLARRDKATATPGNPGAAPGWDSMFANTSGSSTQQSTG
jgi:integrase